MSSTHLKIPIPTDSYDHSTCDVATLTSMKTLITCFDSTMDSFHESIETLTKRLDTIAERTCKIQRQLDSMQQLEDEGSATNKDGYQPQRNQTKMKIAKITYPALYEHAVDMKDVTSELYRHSSVISLAKERAGNAIKSLALEEFAMNENENENNITSASTAMELTAAATETTISGSAKPSDEWLDRASAFEERHNCNMAVQVDTVPPLLSDNSVKNVNSLVQAIKYYNIDDNAHTAIKDILKEEVTYYEKCLKQDEEDDDKASTSTGNNAVIDASTLHQSSNRSLTVDYYDDNMSVISEFTRGAAGATVGVGDHNTVISSYSTISQSGTSASRRRRQRKVMAMAAASSPSVRDKIMKHNDTNGKWSCSASSSRQQALSGSVSYVCDLLHDTYGLVDGSNFAHDNAKVKDVSELLLQQKQQLKTAVVVDNNKLPSQKVSSSEGLYQLMEEAGDE